MAESSRQKSSTTSTTTAVTAPAQAPAAPQCTGNAAAQDRLGLTGAVPAGAGTTEGALAAMGEMGAVVLDALPLGAAMRLALSQKGTPWAEAWVSAQSPGDILLHAVDMVQRGVDAVIPVGFGMELDEAASASHLSVTGAESGALGFMRTPDGLALTIKGGVQAGLAFGLGLGFSGSAGDSALGGGVGASVVQAAAFEATWDFNLLRVLRDLATADPHALTDLLLERPIDLAARLVGLMVDLAFIHSPSSWSSDVRDVGDASGALGTGGFAHGEVGLKADAGVKMGHEGGQSFLEVSTGGSGGAEYDNRLFEVLRKLGLPEFTAAAGCRFRVRVSGSGVDLAALAVENLCFTIATTRTTGDTTVEDAFETPSVTAAIAWMAALLNPADTCFGGEGPTVAACDLPDVALRRSATRSVSDVAEITDPNVVAELLDLATPDKRGFVTLGATAELAAQLYVPVEAVRAALDYQPLPAGPEGIEARVLDVERMIAAEVLGGSCMFPAGVPTVDLAAGAELVDLPKVDAVVKRQLRMGVGGSLKGGVVEEANVNAGLTVTTPVTLSSAIEREQRQALFAS
ncbi:MAG: hypothetical protein V4850_30255 [Myxococcota bacterium]